MKHEKPSIPERKQPTRVEVQARLGESAINYFDESGETTEKPVIHFPKARRHQKHYDDEIVIDGQW